MTLTLNLPPEMEQRLREQADKAGIPADEYALKLLQEKVSAEATPSTGAELVAYWEKEGVLGIWADRTDITDSSEYARKLRRQAERRARD